MKEGWKYVKLGDVCKFQNGFAFKSSSYKKEGSPILRISDIQNDKVSIDNLVFIDKSSYKEDLDQYLVKRGDILIAMSGGTTGKVGINKTDKEFYLNQRVGVFRENKEVLSHYYLFYFLKSKSEEGLKIAAGAAQPNLSTAQIKAYNLPLPPLSQQQQIVDFLDAEFAKIDELKKQAEQSLQNAKDLFQAALKEMLTPKEGWKMVTLPEISDNLDSKRIPVTKGKRDEGKYPYYGASGIVDYVGDYIFDEDLLLISEDGANLLARTYPIAFSVSGKIWVNNHAHVLKFSDLTTQRFVEYYFASIDISDYVTGAAQPKFAQKKMNILPIPYPSIEEQKVVVETLELIEKKIQQLQSNYTRTIQLCADLKQALLRQVFE